MDSPLSRADRRKQKKKERKRKQRQLFAISTKTNSSLPEMEEAHSESSANKSEEDSVTIPAFCEECNEKKVQYHCLDCKHYYCAGVCHSCAFSMLVL